ncbi:UNVERIFIED_CONTAM: hypothetical protein GTU68_016330 [Idotea baltica]|nr:hypothetical protein [Idotea baltica]
MFLFKICSSRCRNDSTKCQATLLGEWMKWARGSMILKNR